MGKHKLKVVEHSLQDQLETAVAFAATARQTLKSAEAELRKRYPDDHRLLMGEVLGMTLVDSERDLRDPNAPVESKRDQFLKERAKISDFQHDVREADSAVDLLRARVAATVTEREKRATLAEAIDAAAKATQSVETVRASVDRARLALTAAETKLSEASIAEETARKAKAGRLLEAIEADRTIETDTSLRQARDAKIEASDDVAFARDALIAVETKLRNAEATIRSSGDQILTCAKAVTASAIPRLLEEAQAMQRDLEARRQVLSLLGDHDDSGAGYGEAVNEYLSGHIFPFEQAGGVPEDHPAVAPWLEIVDALARDADAPLPAN
jgi:hypothetical protein